MTIEDDIAFLETRPALTLLGRDALRILAIGAESRYVHEGMCCSARARRPTAPIVVQEGSFDLAAEGNRAIGAESTVGPRHADRRAGAAHRDQAAGDRDRARAVQRGAHPAPAVPQDARRLSATRRKLRDLIASRNARSVDDMHAVRDVLEEHNKQT